MTQLQPATELAKDFSSPNATPTPWPEAVKRLEEAQVYWISTARPDGQPNVTPLFAVWHERALYFCTGDGEQKAKNIARNSRCAFATGCNDNDGLDVVIEGEARKVSDERLLNELAGMWKSKYDWSWQVKDGAFHDPKAGVTAPVYEVAPKKALGFGKGDVYSQTRWRF